MPGKGTIDKLQIPPSGIMFGAMLFLRRTKMLTVSRKVDAFPLLVRTTQLLQSRYEIQFKLAQVDVGNAIRLLHISTEDRGHRSPRSLIDIYITVSL